MARSTGYALLAALAALVAVVSAVIGIGAGRGNVATRVEAPVGRASASAVPAAAGTWVGTWATAPVGGEPGTANGYAGMSIRNVVHSSVGGTSTRVTLSNAFGTRPLAITHTTIAVAAAGDSPAAVPGTMRALTFGGSGAVTIPVGGSAVSDSAQLAVPGAADLLVTTYSPTPSGPVTYHPQAREISYTASGEHTTQTTGTSFTGQSPYWRYVTAVDVFTARSAGAVVVLGDSITDGVTSTVGANHRWPDQLAARMTASVGNTMRMGVLNEGISGNRVLRDGSALTNPSALNRLDRDVLARAGARTVVVELGINDILHSGGRIDPDAITNGLRLIVSRAHEHGLRVVGGTLMPMQGNPRFSERAESVRQQVNAQIRAGEVYDGVIDFDRALRDPAHQMQLLPAYDSGDHLHPSDAGYLAMADAFALGVLKAGTVSTA
ncbi:SGNH/GDSL hydrolase family protein [Streptomyces sp. NPDC059373]